MKCQNRIRSNWTQLSRVLLLVSLTGVPACTTEEVFEDLDGRMAGPTDVASYGEYFYVLNSDFDRRFNQGSIIVIDPNAAEGAEKRAVVETPRLGRSMFVDEANNLMVVTYDRDEEDGLGLVELRQITEDGLNIALQASWPVSCSPANAMTSPLGNYLVMSCLGGDLWVGKINQENLSQTSFQRVRDYRFTRRALHIYETESKAVLFAFPTDIADQNLADVSLFDTKRLNLGQEIQIDDEGNVTSLEDGANEVPDDFENESSDLRRQQQRFTYQFVVYNLKAEESRGEGFPYVELGSITEPTQANYELRYLYYTLQLESGSYDTNDQYNNPDTKFYRTNFWTAQPDPDYDNVFYLSQRSPANSFILGNDIVRVRINAEVIGDNPEKLPVSSQILQFERVFGYSRDNPNLLNYPGDFEVFQSRGEKLLAINHFRDAVYWSPNQQRFSVDLMSLDQQNRDRFNRPVQRIIGAGFEQSYYQLAINDSGTMMSCSYYGDSVLILDVDVNAGISLRKQLF